MSTRTLLAAAVFLVIQGCSYAISPQIRDSADRSIPYEKLSADPHAYAGRTVILGGEIIDVRQKELDLWGKPRRTNRSGGVFLVLHRAQLDPLIYAAGREITVAGEVTRADKAGTGQDLSGYLILRSRELKLWPSERLTSDKPQWLDPLYDRQSPQSHPGY